ncbi:MULTISPECIES: cobalt-precorrin-7 (C(5))-methyltransferase [Romboutsia]|uniref:Precorrin-6y C5,15-methyltransferase n=1 Tax=Romboutsia hominis TaxID=1507512 RepID=A0A2P2BUT8_9FIRM|nr:MULTISPECIES: cobalt-precorrin-7 (C(5))-methyltransferase [Romboutsia]MDB8794774.1 cobalt-precorrin-7 (C(5))-methyltransferase [Romboutsia sp. 1001216sp1]MDB8797623.1 cobalt-precorrin-7 (C(5))-methyltransferase [Romboutsia sp. 1001216sp1]MDB8800466.1 cobalt-precorrin-7 (C(5))-methyltransferase [Romboutsia sp. 1001216sp1]MDB8806236.1 cobalt-precorrin-7 (C(5))-methyltransferase [Romboutsia sp. 1001216sp1]MDB8808916.1 cobalt-precorrin-7 (C(5))-methyltransferase [Romboutsia sp. 1001216sp1]
MINVIGLGPGNTDYITRLGEKLIKNSDVVIGGRRNLESIKDFEGEKIELASNLKEIVDYINNNKDKQISVIASGDPLMYGIGRYLSKNIDTNKLNIVSGISSLQYIFSKIYVDMNDLYITSSHGKVPDFDYVLSHKKVCMVTDKIIGPKEICKEIIKRNLDKTVVVGENLSYENERITIGKPEEILKVENFDMCVVVILEGGDCI